MACGRIVCASRDRARSRRRADEQAGCHGPAHTTAPVRVPLLRDLLCFAGELTVDQANQPPEEFNPSRAGCLSVLAGALTLALAGLAPLLLHLLSGPYEYPSGLFSGVAAGAGFSVMVLSGTRYREAVLVLNAIVVLGAWLWTLLHWTSGDDGGGMTWSLLVGGACLAVAGFCVIASIVSLTDRGKASEARPPHRLF
jgi:hypothetical protein